MKGKLNYKSEKMSWSREKGLEQVETRKGQNGRERELNI